jgi:hypothetical protein
VRNILLVFIFIFTLTSCQKEDILNSQYEKSLTDSTIVNDTISRKIKLYEIVNKVSKKEPVKTKKRKRFKFKEFIKSKFKKS